MNSLKKSFSLLSYLLCHLFGSLFKNRFFEMDLKEMFRFFPYVSFYQSNDTLLLSLRWHIDSLKRSIIRLGLTSTRGRLATLVYYWAPSSACWAYLEPCPWTARVSCSPFSLSPPCWTSREHVFHQPSISGSLSSTWGKEKPEIKSFSAKRILRLIDYNTKQHLTGYYLEKDNDYLTASILLCLLPDITQPSWGKSFQKEGLDFLALYLYHQ